MLTNLFIIILTVLALAFIWMLWLRNHIALDLRTVQQRFQVLKSDLDKRKDMVPFLLETYKMSKEKNDLWVRLLQERAFFHTGSTLEKEWEYEKTIWSFMREAEGLKTVNFLEAKKDISDMTDVIEKEKHNLEAALAEYNERRKTFPYSLVSGIFGFQNVTL